MNLHYVISTLCSNLNEKALQERDASVYGMTIRLIVKNWNIGTIKQKVLNLAILRRLNQRHILEPFPTSVM